MFCDGCGNPVQSGQAFCSSCGKQIVGTVHTMPVRGRVQEHVRLLGILWMAFSAFNTIGAVVLYVLANTLFAHMNEFGVPREAPTAFLRPLLSVVALVLLAKAAAGFVAGWGLMQHERWARLITLVLAFVCMVTNIPFGTALGIYTMWVLMPARSEQEYDALVASQSAA